LIEDQCQDARKRRLAYATLTVETNVVADLHNGANDLAPLPLTTGKELEVIHGGRRSKRLAHQDEPSHLRQVSRQVASQG
jgi:hypothetical protein